jgi:hypothetical protein
MAYNVTIEQVQNNVTVTPPNSNQIAVSTTAFPVTISYNSTVYDKGEKGDKGDTGDTGPQGIQGIQGEKGDKGDKGDTGDQGPQGIQGDKGDKGDTGDQGPQGIQGDKGDKGDTGDQGIQGIQGAVGPGVAAGGTTDQVLVKSNNTDYATQWVSTVSAATNADNVRIGSTASSDTTTYLMLVPNIATGFQQHFIDAGGLSYNGLTNTLFTDRVQTDNVSSTAGSNLRLDTSLDINSSNITIAQGSNGNITIAPSGTGVISVSRSIIPNANIAYDLGSETNRFRSLYLSSSTIFFEDGALTLQDGVLTVDGETANRLQDETAPALGGNLSTGNFNIQSNDRLKLSAAAAIDIATPIMFLGAGTTKTQIVNSNSSNPGITINSQGGNNSSIAAEVRIGTSSQGNIDLVPKTGGRVIASGNKLPDSTGSSGQILRTDGAGDTYWDDEDLTIISENEPQIAAIGQQWLNPTTQILKVYTAAGWVQVTADDLQF